MKIFIRILFAMTAVLMFLFALDYSRGLMTSLYFEKYGEAALNEPDPDYFFFYSSIPDYHQETPIFSVDANGYRVRMYEVATIGEDTVNVNAELYYYLIVHSTTLTLDDGMMVRLINGHNQASVLISIARFRSLNVMMGVNPDGYVYIDPLWFSSDYDTFELEAVDGTVLLSVDFSLPEEDQSIADRINTYFQENGTLPDMALQDQGIFPANPHVMTEYEHIFWISMAIYFLVLGLATYFLFFFHPHRKNSLGIK
ncbi:MAG: hypothetical protein AB7S88_00815 [Candidatus Izemoplasmatales bacterium]